MKRTLYIQDVLKPPPDFEGEVVILQDREDLEKLYALQLTPPLTIICSNSTLLKHLLKFIEEYPNDLFLVTQEFVPGSVVSRFQDFKKQFVFPKNYKPPLMRALPDKYREVLIKMAYQSKRNEDKRG